MAEQYLNKEGVQTLWSAVKNKISTAQQTVENEFTNGTKIAKTASNANNLGGVAPAGYLKQVKVGNTTYTANNSLISLPSYATLDSSGKVPSSQLPSYVDDVIEGYYSGGTFFYNKDWTNEISGETGKIYVDLNSSKTYRWGGSAYVEISASLAIGTKAGTAYDGALGAKNASDISKNAMAISDLQTQVSADMTAIGILNTGKADKDHTHTFASLTSKPSTLSGYGISDGVQNSVTSTVSGVTGTSKILNGDEGGITLSWGQDSNDLHAIYINKDGIAFKVGGAFVTYAQEADIPKAISTSELNSILV